MEPINYPLLAEPTFRFGKVVILESLRADDAPPHARDIEHFIKMALIGEKVLSVERRVCATSEAFLEELSALGRDALEGEIPIIHVECHGGKDVGLEFTEIGRASCRERV